MIQNNHTPKKLRAKQVAELYGISIPTVWNYARQRKFQAIKISYNVTVFDAEQVDRFFNTSIKELDNE